MSNENHSYNSLEIQLYYSYNNKPLSIDHHENDRMIKLNCFSNCQ